MKLSRIASLLAGAAILGGAQVALAYDGMITFNGEITSSTCVINNGTGADFAVQLPTVSASALPVDGTSAGWTQFDIELSNCTGALTNALAYFELGVDVDPATGRLENRASNGAENVQVALRDAGGAENIVIGVPNSTQATVDVSSGSGVLRYEAGYWATGGAAGAGPVETTVTYTIAYR